MAIKMGTRTLFLLMLIGPIGGVKIGTYDSRTSQVQASFEGTAHRGHGQATAQDGPSPEPIVGDEADVWETKKTPWEEASLLTAKVLQLRDGRELRYGWGYTPSTQGGEKTVTVLALHGMGMGGFEMWPWKEITSGKTFTGLTTKSGEPARVRFVAIDRPGYSESSPPPFGYSYKDFADDVEELIETDKELFPDGEGILVIGTSSGGPNMLALSYYLKDKVLAGASVSGDGPYMHTRNRANADGVNAANVATARDNDLGLYLFDSNIPDFCGAWGPTFDPSKGLWPPPPEDKPLHPSLKFKRGNGGKLKELCDNDKLKRDQLHGTDLKTFGQDFLPVFFKAIEVNDNWEGTLGWVNDFSLERLPWPFDVAHVQAPVNIYTGGCENCKASDFAKQGKNDDFCPICASAAFLEELLPNGKTKTTFSDQYEGAESHCYDDPVAPASSWFAQQRSEEEAEAEVCVKKVTGIAKYNHFYSFKKAATLKIIVQDLIDAAMDEKLLEAKEPGICHQCKTCKGNFKFFDGPENPNPNRAPGPPFPSPLDGGLCVAGLQHKAYDVSATCAEVCGGTKAAVHDLVEGSARHPSPEGEATGDAGAAMYKEFAQRGGTKAAVQPS